MVSRKRFLKAISDLKELIASQKVKRVLCNHSCFEDKEFIEVSIFSLEDAMEDDMWDIDIIWYGTPKKISMTAALLTGDGLIKWYSPQENLGDILAKDSLEKLIKEWIVFNLDLFIDDSI